MYRKLILLLAAVIALASAGRAKNQPKTISAFSDKIENPATLKNKVVYVDFWASWCVPCRKSLPFLNSIAARYRDQGLRVLAVNLDKDHTAARKFLDEMNISLEVVYDSTGALAKLFDLKAMPTSIVFARNGQLRKTMEGFQQKDTLDIKSMVTQMLKEDSPK